MERRDGHRDAVWLLATQALRRRVSGRHAEGLGPLCLASILNSAGIYLPKSDSGELGSSRNCGTAIRSSPAWLRGENRFQRWMLEHGQQQDRKMSHHLERVAAMLARSGGGGGEKLKQWLMFSVLAITLTGCGFTTSRDVRASNACITRHPQEVPVCGGPRQAYELEPTGFRQE